MDCSITPPDGPSRYSVGAATGLVSPRVPLVDPDTGIVSNEWYRFLASLYSLTGSGQSSVSTTDLQVLPPVIPPPDYSDVPSAFPQGGVIFYVGAACPTGFSENTTLRGRFPRGMPLSGTPGATGGSTTTDAGGALTGFYIDAAGTHHHSVPPQGTTTDTLNNTSAGWTPNGGAVNVATSTSTYNIGHNHGDTSDNGNHQHNLNIPDHTHGALPPYVDGLWCQKD